MSVPPEAMARGPMSQAVQQGVSDPRGGPGAPQPPGAIAAQGGRTIPYEQLFDNFSKIIDGEPGLEKIQEKVMGMLARGSQNPAFALSQTTLAVGELVFADAQKNGVEIPDDDLAAAAMDTLTSLDELAESAGIFQASDEDLQEAFNLTLEGWMKAHPEMIDREAMRQSLEGLDPEMVAEAQDLYGGVQPTQTGGAGGPAPQGGLING